MTRFLLEIVGAAALAGGLAYAQSRDEHTASSRVQLWLVDPAGQVDGVLLRDGRQMYFSPDVGRNLTLSVRIGDPIHVTVDRGRRFVVDERDDNRFELTPVLAHGGGPASVAALQHLTASGNVVTFLRTPDGVIDGFVLSTGAQVRFPPVLGPRLASVRLGDRLVVEGLGTRGAYGTGITPLAVRDARNRLLFWR